jgi:phospholipid N-methyltransferase
MNTKINLLNDAKIFPMRHLNTFVGQSLKDFIRLARRMVKDINSPVVVELGPGTGVITKEILKRLPQNGLLISIENNIKFVRYLEDHIKDERLVLCTGDAMDLKTILQKNGVEKVGCIVSGLPLGHFKSDDKRRLLKEINACLEDGGVFVQFQYFLAGIRAIKSIFPWVNISYEIFNMPPAFVMKCRKQKHADHR